MTSELRDDVSLPRTRCRSISMTSLPLRASAAAHADRPHRHQSRLRAWSFSAYTRARDGAPSAPLVRAGAREATSRRGAMRALLALTESLTVTTFPRGIAARGHGCRGACAAREPRVHPVARRLAERAPLRRALGRRYAAHEADELPSRAGRHRLGRGLPQGLPICIDDVEKDARFPSRGKQGLRLSD